MAEQLSQNGLDATSNTQGISSSTDVRPITNISERRFEGLGRAQSRFRGMRIQQPGSSVGNTSSLRRPRITVAGIGRGQTQKRQESVNASEIRGPREDRIQCSVATIIQANQLDDDKKENGAFENRHLKISPDANKNFEPDDTGDGNMLVLDTTSEMRYVPLPRNDPCMKKNRTLETPTEPIPVNNEAVSIVRSVQDCTSLENESKSRTFECNTSNHASSSGKWPANKTTYQGTNISCNGEPATDKQSFHVSSTDADGLTLNKRRNENQKNCKKTHITGKPRTFLNGAKSTCPLRNAIYAHLKIRPEDVTNGITKDCVEESEEEENWDQAMSSTEPLKSTAGEDVSHYFNNEGNVKDDAAFYNFSSRHASPHGGGSASPPGPESWDKNSISGNVHCCRLGRPSRRTNRAKKDQPLGSPIRIIRLAAPEEMPTTLRDLAYVDNSPVDVEPQLPSLLLRCMIGK